MTITATIDRFENDLAVLVVEPEQTVVNVPRSELPHEVSQGDVLRLQVQIDQEETQRRRTAVQEKIERLKQRSSEQG